MVHLPLTHHQSGAIKKSIRLVDYVQSTLPLPSSKLVNSPNKRGGEWYPENCGSWKILARSRNLGSVSTESLRLVFSCLVQKSLESWARIFKQGSRRVSDFTIYHP